MKDLIPGILVATFLNCIIYTATFALSTSPAYQVCILVGLNLIAAAVCLISLRSDQKKYSEN